MVSDLAEQEALVATVTEALAGNTVNVIPTHGTLRGTLRTLSQEQRSLLHRALLRLTADVAAEVGLDHAIDITAGYPAVVNDDEFLSAVLAQLGREEAAARAVTMNEPSMVIEDFSYLLHRWRGAMVYLGAQVDSRQVFNHSADVLFEEAAMSAGLALHSMVADLDV